MACRIEWVKAKLENWGRWASEGSSGGLGYPRRAAFVRLAPSRSCDTDRIPVDDIDAAKIDAHIKVLMAEHSHLHRLVVLVYREGKGIKDAAREMVRNESTIKANLAQVDGWVAARLLSGR